MLYKMMYGIRSYDDEGKPEVSDGKPVYDEIGQVEEIPPSQKREELDTKAAEWNANPPSNPHGVQPDEYWVTAL